MILYRRKETTYIPTPILVIGRRPCTARFVVNSLQYYLGSGLPERSFNDTLRAQKKTRYIPTSILVVGRRPYTARF